jgi:hypothetical protein
MIQWPVPPDPPSFVRVGDSVVYLDGTTYSVTAVDPVRLTPWPWWRYWTAPMRRWLVRQHCHLIGKERLAWWR